jgi:hypothetical protein
MKRGVAFRVGVMGGVVRILGVVVMMIVRR